MDPLPLLASLTCPTLTLITLSYGLVCAASPYGRCRRCHGHRRLHSRIVHRLHRPCPRCDGTGLRVRLGHRAFEHIRAQYRDGTR